VQVSGLPSGMKASDLLRTAPHDFYNPNQNQVQFPVLRLSFPLHEKRGA